VKTHDHQPTPLSGDPPPVALVVCLVLGGVLAALMGLAGGVLSLRERLLDGHPIDFWAIVGGLCWCASGMIAAMVLGTLAWGVHRLHAAARVRRRFLESAERIERLLVSPRPEPATSTPTDSPVAKRQAALLEDILAGLRDLNASLLLSDDERRQRATQQRENGLVRASDAFDAALGAQDFAQARAALADMGSWSADETELSSRRERLEQAREDALARELEAARGQAEDLMALSNYDRAVEVALSLARRFPGENAAKDLLERVRCETDTYHEEQSKRLYAEVRRNSDARRWGRALEAARQLLSGHDQRPEAPTVRAMLPTLEENARIEEVRRMRDEFTDLLRRRRYAEALTVGEEILVKFPETRAARDLRVQMPRLRRRVEEAH
jgi:hypothetical protein